MSIHPLLEMSVVNYSIEKMMTRGVAIEMIEKIAFFDKFWT